MCAEVLEALYREKAVQALREGEAIIFPTDTIFGLGVSVNHAQTPGVLYNLKRRDAGKPIAWLVGSKNDLLRYGNHVPSYAQNLAEKFWPGPLTLIVRASSLVPPAFASAKNTIALRMPDNKEALLLIAEVGCPLATTSANISGEESVCVFDDISPELLNRVNVAFDDNQTKSGVASTVVDCTGVEPVVLRQGVLDIANLER